MVVSRPQTPPWLWEFERILFCPKVGSVVIMGERKRASVAFQKWTKDLLCPRPEIQRIFLARNSLLKQECPQDVTNQDTAPSMSPKAKTTRRNSNNHSNKGRRMQCDKVLHKYQPMSPKSWHMARIGHVRENGWTVEEKRERNHAVELTSF